MLRCNESIMVVSVVCMTNDSCTRVPVFRFDLCKFKRRGFSNHRRRRFASCEVMRNNENGTRLLWRRLAIFQYLYNSLHAVMIPIRVCARFSGRANMKRPTT